MKKFLICFLMCLCSVVYSEIHIETKPVTSEYLYDTTDTITCDDTLGRFDTIKYTCNDTIVIKYDVPTHLDTIKAVSRAKKYVGRGIVIIIRDGMIYTLTGQRIN